MSAPALIWDEMLSMAKAELEVTSDDDMYMFFEKNMRGGVFYISNRYSKASNKHLKSYDPNQEFKHIIYLVANDLYGFAISQFLPTDGFKWIDPKEFDMNKYTKISSKGCVLKVDLEYPKKREVHNKYSLAPNKKEITKEMLSSYQLKFVYSDNIPIGSVKNLVPNVFDKEKYVFHYENLKIYLRLGLKLKKILRVLELSQSQ